jgi:hypothetical protein
MTTRTVQFYGQGYSVPIEGLGLTPNTITATIDGNVVFSGAIPTVYSSDILRIPGDQVILFTCEIPLVVGGNVGYVLPASLAMTGDDIYLEQINANYSRITNPVYSPEQLAIVTTPSAPVEEKIAIWETLAVPPLSAEDIAVLSTNVWAVTEPILAAHNLLVTISSGPTGFAAINIGSDATNSDPRSNVVITNATYVSPSPPDPLPPELYGAWGWEVETAAGQTSIMTFDLNVTPGLE